MKSSTRTPAVCIKEILILQSLIDSTLGWLKFRTFTSNSRCVLPVATSAFFGNAVRCRLLRLTSNVESLLPPALPPPLLPPAAPPPRVAFRCPAAGTATGVPRCRAVESGEVSCQGGAAATTAPGVVAAVAAVASELSSDEAAEERVAQRVRRPRERSAQVCSSGGREPLSERGRRRGAQRGDVEYHTEGVRTVRQELGPTVSKMSSGLMQRFMKNKFIGAYNKPLGLHLFQRTIK